jgi:hypothetical protein
MAEIFNIILIIIILIIVYYCIQNNKKKELINISNDTSNNLPNYIPNNILKTNIENFNDLDTKFINFDYDLRPIEKEFIKEQNDGIYLNTWYPNTWIDYIDENEKPVYNSRENVTGKKETIIDGPKSSFSYDFNNTKTTNISSALKPEDTGKTIKEIYDNSMVNYKNLGPTKNQITDETSDIVMPGGSNLTYFAADTWTYENENESNGGLIYDNVYGDDPMSNTVAVF